MHSDAHLTRVEPAMRPSVDGLRGSELISVRPMLLTDLPHVLRLHAKEFDDSIFTRLGSRFLETYLSSFVDAPHAVALIAHDHSGSRERSLAYLVGVVETGPHREWLRRNRLRAFAAELALSASLHPVLIGRVLARRSWVTLGRAARRTRVAAGAPEVSAAPLAGAGRDVVAEAGATVGRQPPAVLSYVACRPAARGRGAGTLLMNSFEREVANAGVRWMALATASHGAACVFYERRGWVRDRERFTADGRCLSFYSRRVGDGA